MLPLTEYIKHPKVLITSLLREYGGWIPDKQYLQMMYYLKMGKRLNLKNPQTFNEKLQWLKLFDRKPEYTMMVDKLAVKDYVASVIGSDCIIPTLGVWDKPEDIDFDILPNQFVLKTTHGGGSRGVVICSNICSFDRGGAVKKLRKSMKQNIYRALREWPYKTVKPKIIAEKYLCDEYGTDYLTDYKFFCFNGYADCVMICIDRQKDDSKFYFFDREWKLLPLNVRGKNTDSSFMLPKPACIQEMFEIAGKLSEGIPFLRVDLYCSEGKTYFGEATFFPDSGFDRNLLNETERLFGDKIDLSIVK